MALHYSNDLVKTACGRAATSSNATSDTQGITCKTCLKATAASQCITPVVESEKVVDHRGAKRAPAPAERKKGVAFTEWRAGLNENERPPRGKQIRSQRRGSSLRNKRTAA
ncbi:hypothetical protein [Pseudomonas savastanoi]|uniref:hypothetical protein n=1 Tax=Pseudomonas savastanoi TaxID=29438 RepID=UPI000E32AA65|nr:hypothetical protein [Pseudomonas savastanoi]